MNTFPWTIFYILLAAGIIGTAAVIPYSLSINSRVLEALKANKGETGQAGEATKRMPPMLVMILISGLQSVVLIGAATFLGLLAARQVGLETPILRAAVEGQPVMDKILAMAPLALLLGLATGIVMLVLEWTVFMPRIPRSLAGLDARIAFWKRVLACFYGGVVEEILMRLFLMSGLVWLLSLVWKTATVAPAGVQSVGPYWLGNILAALLFGAGHLPATAQVVKLTSTVVARALLLNGIPGVACGYLFMVYGLEAAMLLHFSLDILIHLIAPPISQRIVNALPPEPDLDVQAVR